MGALSLELAPGGGGGVDRPLRPVANEDEEGPDRRMRAVMAVRTLRVLRGGTDDESSVGIVPPEAQELLHRSSRDTLPTDTGQIALRDFRISYVDESFN